jgi:hypothetical protein
MTYRGRIEHGVVVLDGSHALPEGTEVEVLPVPPANRAVGEGLEKLAGKAQDLPADLAERHDH